MAQPTDPQKTFQRAQPSGWQIALALLALFLISALWQAAMTSGPQELS